MMMQQNKRTGINGEHALREGQSGIVKKKGEIPMKLRQKTNVFDRYKTADDEFFNK